MVTPLDRVLVLLRPLLPRCGNLYGSPRPARSGQSWRFDIGSQWKQPLYTCASSVRASVKEVEFSTDGTNSLTSLQVVNVKDKTYPNASSEPLWGVEKVKGITVGGIGLFWGIVDDSQVDNPQVETRRGRSLFLPVAGKSLLSELMDGFAPGTAYVAAWNSVYNSAGLDAGLNVGNIPR
jgi:hypothetical protein